jgi:hypothetical protein
MTTVNFTPTEPSVQRGVSVIFFAEADGHDIKCAITSEALRDRFGGNYHDPRSAFLRNRETIERIATNLINESRFEPDGSILIKTQDI